MKALLLHLECAIFTFSQFHLCHHAAGHPLRGVRVRDAVLHHGPVLPLRHPHHLLLVPARLRRPGRQHQLRVPGVEVRKGRQDSGVRMLHSANGNLRILG